MIYLLFHNFENNSMTYNRLVFQGKKSILITTIVLGIVFSVMTFSATYAQEKYEIPSWIKQTAGFWAEEKISDQDFGESLSFLIENEIINIPQMEKLKIENQQLKEEMKSFEERLQIVEGKSGPILQNFDEDLQIKVYSNKKEFGPNDSIVIFGTVNKVIDEQKVGIVFSDANGKTAAIAKIQPNDDGSFGFVADGPKFRHSGFYTVSLYYGGEAFTQTTYEYNPIG